jgi:hypothetical protein
MFSPPPRAAVCLIPGTCLPALFFFLLTDDSSQTCVCVMFLALLLDRSEQDEMLQELPPTLTKELRDHLYAKYWQIEQMKFWRILMFARLDKRDQIALCTAFKVSSIRKRVLLLCHFCIEVIFLPRQARDKHGESTQKETRVLIADVRRAEKDNL